MTTVGQSKTLNIPLRRVIFFAENNLETFLFHPNEEWEIF